MDKALPYKGEILGISAGMLLATSQKEREKIKEIIRIAYEIRNCLVHGSLEKIEKYEKKSEEIYRDLEEYARKALKKLIMEKHD